MTRPPDATAGFLVSVKGRRVFLVLVDPEQGRDPGMSHHDEATELAQRLLHAAAVVERRQRSGPSVAGRGRGNVTADRLPLTPAQQQTARELPRYRGWLRSTGRSPEEWGQAEGEDEGE